MPPAQVLAFNRAVVMAGNPSLGYAGFPIVIQADIVNEDKLSRITATTEKKIFFWPITLKDK